jgi:hypothetical protein
MVLHGLAAKKSSPVRAQSRTVQSWPGTPLDPSMLSGQASPQVAEELLRWRARLTRYFWTLRRLMMARAKKMMLANQAVRRGLRSPL